MVKLLGATIKPRILNVNIKARRLGYVTQCLNLLKPSLSWTLDNVIERLESLGTQHQKELEAYVENSGYIKETKKHYPAKRYIKLMQELQLIKITGRSCRVSKLGEPLHFLQPIYNNPFDLTIEQECYLLRRLLISDFDVLLPLYRLLQDHDNVPTIFRLFKNAFVDQLEKRTEAIGDLLRASDFRNQIYSIGRWTKEKKYLEHIIYPRISWLIDLKLFDLEIFVKGRLLRLNDAGKRIFSNLEKTYEEEHLEHWFANRFYEQFAEAKHSRFAIKEMARLSDLPEDGTVQESGRHVE